MNGIDIGKAVGALLMAVVAVVAIGYIGNALVPVGGEGEARVVTAAGGESGDADVAAEPEAEEATAEAAEEAAAEASEEVVAEAVEEAAAPAAPGIDLAMADVAAGQKLFKKCGICHTVAAGGPNLFGIVGRAVGGHAGFGYSGAMAGLGGTWTVEMLNGFLAKPKEFLPDTKMKFSGLKKVEDRANRIAYLATLAD